MPSEGVEFRGVTELHLGVLQEGTILDLGGFCGWQDVLSVRLADLVRRVTPEGTLFLRHLHA